MSYTRPNGVFADFQFPGELFDRPIGHAANFGTGLVQTVFASGWEGLSIGGDTRVAKKHELIAPAGFSGAAFGWVELALDATRSVPEVTSIAKK